MTTLAPPSAPNPAESDAVGHLVIPKIGVDVFVIQGTDDSDLRKGPGHYPATPFPGQRGNAAIAGHRTTYGAPFGDLDGLEVGDTIQITTLQGSFDYRVYDTLIVSPTDSEVLEADPTRPGDDHAHHVQPEVLGRRTAHHQGRAGDPRRGATPGVQRRP